MQNGKRKGDFEESVTKIDEYIKVGKNKRKMKSQHTLSFNIAKEIMEITL